MPDDSSVPSPDQAATAVNVVLHGGKRSHFTVNTAVADNGASARVSAEQIETTPAAYKESGWTKTIAIWTAGVLVAALTLYLSRK